MELKEVTRKLRKEQTPQEKILWEHLRNRQLSGKKFLRQYPIKFNFDGIERFFIADFYCSELKIVIELDGKIHEKQKDYDQLRDEIILARGIKVIRFSNEEIEKDISNILLKLRSSITYL